ncbi:MAG TPA: XrtA/PEP-CTERM system exopolysaccharide export protein [Rudaea sp.]
MKLAIALLSAALLIRPVAPQCAQPPATAGTAPQAVATYRIGVDDLVKVSVWRNPDLDATVPVRPDGKISLPLIGDVTAGGRTPDEVSADIKERLTAFVRDPQVAVILTELRSHEYLSRVRVTGAVKQPVSITYRQGMTVLDAVLAAGGLTDFAAADRAELYRKDGNGTKTLDVRLGKIMKKGDLETNFPVQPGDIITVPERLF